MKVLELRQYTIKRPLGALVSRVLSARIIRALVHRRLVPRWVQRRIWTREHATGQWDSRSLHTPNDPIYPLLARYCAGRDVCDVGCGQGNTVTEMDPVYRSYTGVDIADDALRIATERTAKAGRERVRFCQGFMHSYIPEHPPDVFLFRESLHYVSRNRSHVLDDMSAFLHRYVEMLAPGGLIIVRQCTDGLDARAYADQVEVVIRREFGVLECRRTQQPSALLVVFQPFPAQLIKRDGNVRVHDCK